MKWFLTLAALMLITLGTVSAQEMPELDASPMDAAYFPNRAAFRAFADTDAQKMAMQPVMKVVYSRPQKKGRDIFGDLISYGEVWRAGANESTEITFFEDVVVGDTKVKAGRYTLYTVPGEDEWEVMINTDLDGWGAYAYSADNNVATITVPSMDTEDTVEAFTIMFEEVEDGAHLIMAWDDTMVRVPVKTWSM
jgi:hypothetical protein